MSKEGQEKAAVSKFGLVTKIMALLNLGDSAKLDNFLGRIIKASKTTIERLEQNLATFELEYKSKISELEDSLEDALNDEESAYLAIPLDEIQSNQAQKDYMPTYLGAIADAEAKVKSLKEEIKEAKDRVSKERADVKAKIAVHKARIDKFMNA